MSVDYKELTGKLIQENSSLSNELSHALNELDDIYQIVESEPNNMKLGKIIRQHYWDNTEETIEEEPVYVYESPDNGKTLYRRRIGDAARERMEEPKQMNLFGDED